MGCAYAEALALEFATLCDSALRPHFIPLSPNSRLLADSAKLGWRDAFASIVSRRAWTGRLEPIDHPALLYCLRGVNQVERKLDGETEKLRFQPRQLALYPTHAPADFRVSGEADVLAVYLRAGMVRSVADRLFGASTKPLHLQPLMGFNDPLLEQFCLTFADALHRQREDASRYMDQVAESMAAHVLVRYRADARPPESTNAAALETALGRLASYVDEHLEGDLSVERLAREAALTPAALKRAFASVYQATPRQWIIRRRIAHAERMLADTDLPLAEIALRAGFASQSHLCSTFKREIGRPPGEYRRAR